MSFNSTLKLKINLPGVHFFIFHGPFSDFNPIWRAHTCDSPPVLITRLLFIRAKVLSGAKELIWLHTGLTLEKKKGTLNRS